MKYEVEIGSRQLSIELEQKNSSVHARIGSRNYKLEVFRPEAGVFTFLDGGRVYEARVFEAEQDALRVEIKGREFAVKIIDRKHRRAAAEHSIEGRQNLVAPMPGKIVRVLLAVGDEVKSGQGVVVVEAMKMQNEIKSPKSGHVVEIRVAEGATVNANQVLAVVE